MRNDLPHSFFRAGQESSPCAHIAEQLSGVKPFTQPFPILLRLPGGLPCQVIPNHLQLWQKAQVTPQLRRAAANFRRKRGEQRYSQGAHSLPWHAAAKLLTSFSGEQRHVELLFGQLPPCPRRFFAANGFPPAPAPAALFRAASADRQTLFATHLPAPAHLQLETQNPFARAPPDRALPPPDRLPSLDTHNTWLRSLPPRTARILKEAPVDPPPYKVLAAEID